MSISWTLILILCVPVYDCVAIHLDVFIFSQCASWWNSVNYAFWLVLSAGGIFQFCPSTWTNLSQDLGLAFLVFQQPTCRSVCIGKIVPFVFNLTQDFGHSFPQYCPSGWWITSLYFFPNQPPDQLALILLKKSGLWNFCLNWLFNIKVSESECFPFARIECIILKGWCCKVWKIITPKMVRAILKNFEGLG